MSLKRRLANLEGRPSRKPSSAVSPPASGGAMETSVKKKLGLPLPAQASESERQQGLQILRDAIARLKADAGDTAGFDAVQAFAQSVHEKYRPE